ncbi:hypothetical protein CSAL01_09291 [Colletotrichum salicis]|uniref:Uncharacterized protein n=1 Tax=Colletotrichum salicis TaxID=1209931 RepID=A0A135V9P9_9PEZI|nr:hypothetical protein CSAL01_09291 [Colletotrichum salicis]
MPSSTLLRGPDAVRTCDSASDVFRTSFSVAFALLKTSWKTSRIATRDFYAVLPDTALGCQTSSAHPGQQQPVVCLSSLANPVPLKRSLRNTVSNCISKTPLAEAVSDIEAPNKPQDAPKELDPDPSWTRANPASMQVIGGASWGRGWDGVEHLFHFRGALAHADGRLTCCYFASVQNQHLSTGWLQCLAALHALSVFTALSAGAYSKDGEFRDQPSCVMDSMLRRFRAVSEILSRMRAVGISLVCLSALRSTELGGVHGRLDGSGRRRTRGIWAATFAFSSSACGGIDHGYRWTDRLTNEPPPNTRSAQQKDAA